MRPDTVEPALRRSVATRRRRWLLAITLVVGLLAAAGLTAGAPPEDRTFATFANAVQGLMSVLTPLIGILLTHDLRQPPGRAGSVAPTLLAATVLAAGIGVVGSLIAAGGLALAPASSDRQPWQYAATIAVGGVLVQIVAMLTGTGLGLLLRSPVVAFLASIVVPLGLYLILGIAGSLRDWLTPYGALLNLLSGEMTAARWMGWVVVFLIWGVGLNAAGAARLRRPAGD
jgi:hypothetical protein